MLMKSDISEPTNIGNPNEMTINELACKIIELTSSKSSVIFMKLPEDDPKKRKPVIKKAIEKLNWYPRVSLEDGLIKTINYYKSI